MVSTRSGAAAESVSRFKGTTSGPQRRPLIRVPPGRGSITSSKAHRSLPQHARSSISEGRGVHCSASLGSSSAGEGVGFTLVPGLPVALDLVVDEERLLVAGHGGL